MPRIENWAAGIATVYLLLYCILLQFERSHVIASWMLMLSPLILTGMGIAILRGTAYKGRTLEEDEFGYQDKH